MLFRELAIYLERLEKTSSRIEITKILADLFKKSDRDEINKTVYLLLGYLAPSYEGIVFNLAERMMVRILAKAYAKDTEFVKKLYKEKGDLGETAFALAQIKNLKFKIKNLSIAEVYERLKEIAVEKGEESQERKIDKMAKLLRAIDPQSAKFVARIPVGRLRLGFSDRTIIDALSWMQTGDKSKSAKLIKAYEVVPNVGLLARRVKEVGIDKASKNIKPVVGVPVLPMLAQRIKSPTEMIEKMKKVFVEPKFDGLRVLIHFKRLKGKDMVRAFTRNLNNIIDMFPELNGVGKYVNAKEVILDSEAVGMDPEMKRLANFQTTMRRRRKHEIEQKAKDIPVRFQVFDIVLKNGESLMDKPYDERREILKKVIKENSVFIVDDAIVTSDPKVINREYQKNVAAGLEGVIVKKYDTPYIPGRTGWRWVKMKEEEKATGKLADTVDCIVMGYTSGRGKRASFGIGQFLAGVKEGELIKSVTKVGTGLTDEQFKELAKRLKKIEIKQKPKEYEVHKELEPDFWVEPEVVVELAADEITKSPKHTAGLALRFPRLVRFRDDKGPEQATTVAEVKKLYNLQFNYQG